MTEPNSGFDLQTALKEGGSGIGPWTQSLRHLILGDDVLLKIGEVAFLVGCSQRQIYAMIHRRTFPGPKKLGVLSRWRLGIVKKWLRADELRRC